MLCEPKMDLPRTPDLPRALSLALVLLPALTAMAHAHVALEYTVAPASSSYKASFKVPHGCGASPTRQFVVDIPAGVRGARPMPKSGWTIEIRREVPAQPAESQGRRVTEDATRISWTARTADDMLASAHYDEFVVVAQLPAQAGTLWWPVHQVCEQGRLDWVQVPGPGQKASDLSAPAVPLEVMPSGAGAGHHAH